MGRRVASSISVIALVMIAPSAAFGMHIADGVLPLPWVGLWWAVVLPFLASGLRTLGKLPVAASGRAMVGLVGAALFVISCMPIPVPFAGTSSHACGSGLAAILIGPALTVVVASVALVLQALLLGDGGLGTLGANILSMGVVGGYVGFAVFRLARRLGLSVVVGAFLAGMLSDWATYAMTSFQLASALRGDGSFVRMLVAVLLAFVPTQLPIGIIEGVVVAGACRFLLARRPELLERLTGRAA